VSGDIDVQLFAIEHHAPKRKWFLPTKWFWNNLAEAAAHNARARAKALAKHAPKPATPTKEESDVKRRSNRRRGTRDPEPDWFQPADAAAPAG
jgi:hypothetical protein